MSKHTPGPWEVSSTGPRYSINASGTVATKHIAMVSCTEVFRGEVEVNVANAHLIAAAPDLLEALEHITQTPEYKFLYPGTVSMIEQAIAKAKGETK